jgi:hypothetical protein
MYKKQIVISSKDRVSGQSLHTTSYQLKNALVVKSIKFKNFITHHSILPYDAGDSLFWTVGTTHSAVMTVPTSWSRPA